LPGHATQPARSPGPPIPATPPPPPREHAFRFTGTAGEYFRIWAVNLALTVATLGVYSAWAKVRKKRYFYGHTELAGDTFEYRGQPLAILKGRILAVAVAAIVFVAFRFAPVLLWVVLPAAILVVPWLIVRSFAFNARNSAWRNLRLRFDGGYGRCWRIFNGYGLLVLLTFGLLYYRLKARLTAFLVAHHAFGTTRFEVEDLLKPFARAYVRMIGLAILGSFGMGIVVFAVIGAVGPQRHDSPIAMALNLGYYVMYLALFAYIRARVLNATWNAVRLGDFTFRSTLGARALFKLYLGNIAAIVATLGLATPWAVVRTFRYRAEHLALAGAGDLEAFVAAQSGEVGAGGEEVGEMLDMDFSL
jgi:uncharacterized membrane protein YjgN (DUF898 family)